MNFEHLKIGFIQEGIIFNITINNKIIPFKITEYGCFITCQMKNDDEKKSFFIEYNIKEKDYQEFGKYLKKSFVIYFENQFNNMMFLHNNKIKRMW